MITTTAGQLPCNYSPNKSAKSFSDRDQIQSSIASAGRALEHENSGTEKHCQIKQSQPLSQIPLNKQRHEQARQRGHQTTEFRKSRNEVIPTTATLSSRATNLSITFSDRNLSIQNQSAIANSARALKHKHGGTDIHGARAS